MKLGPCSSISSKFTTSIFGAVFPLLIIGNMGFLLCFPLPLLFPLLLNVDIESVLLTECVYFRALSCDRTFRLNISGYKRADPARVTPSRLGSVYFLQSTVYSDNFRIKVLT